MAVQKRARYIEKNNSIMQEFSFAHPVTKMKLNSVYNCHFYGSPLWDLFSTGAKQFEASFNKSVKIMCELPYETHRYLIGPVSGGEGFRVQLFKKYLGFISRIMDSPKPVLKQLLNLAKVDVRTTTGGNLRNIHMLTTHFSVNALEPKSVEGISYNDIKSEEKWRVKLIQEVIEMKHGNLCIPDGWTINELNEVLHLACVS